MRATILTLCVCLGLAGAARAASDPRDYTGPFTTQVLYTMCSQNNPAARANCELYIQGLMNGLRMQRAMQEKGMPVCLPDMSVEAARQRIIGFITTTTAGKPESNKAGGDWMAFLGLASGNFCKK